MTDIFFYVFFGMIIVGVVTALGWLILRADQRAMSIDSVTTYCVDSDKYIFYHGDLEVIRNGC